MIYSIIVGLIAGWLAGQVMKGGGYGMLMDIVLGLLGGIIGGASRLRDAKSPAAIVLASSREKSDFGTLVAESGACGLIEKSLLSGDAVRALVTVSRPRDILARP